MITHFEQSWLEIHDFSDKLENVINQEHASVLNFIEFLFNH